MTASLRKRPHQPNQLAKMPVDIVADEIKDFEAGPAKKKDPAAVKRGHLGGKARASIMTPSERKASALKAVRARWSKRRYFIKR